MEHGMDHAAYLPAILQFLHEIGIGVVERNLPHKTFLPGLELGPGCLYVDYQRLRFVGDMLHEAGHLAVTPPEHRACIGSPDLPPDWPPHGEELAALLWSFAAARRIEVPLPVLFHPGGYKDDSAWLIETFESGLFIGLPLLEWMDLTLSPARAQAQGLPAFPHMLKWMRTRPGGEAANAAQECN